VLSPGVRRLVTEYNLNPDIIKSTGNKSKLLKGDVLRYIKEKSLIPEKKDNSMANIKWSSESTTPTATTFTTTNK